MLARDNRKFKNRLIVSSNNNGFVKTVDLQNKKKMENGQSIKI